MDSLEQQLDRAWAMALGAQSDRERAEETLAALKRKELQTAVDFQTAFEHWQRGRNHKPAGRTQ